MTTTDAETAADEHEITRQVSYNLTVASHTHTVRMTN